MAALISHLVTPIAAIAAALDGSISEPKGVTRWRRKIRLRNSDAPANWKSGNFRHVLRDLTRSITDRIIVVIDDDRRITVAVVQYGNKTTRV